MFTEIRLSVGKTVNLGDSNSIRIDAGVTIRVEEGDDIGVLKQRGQEELRTLLAETYSAQMKKKELSA